MDGVSARLNESGSSGDSGQPPVWIMHAKVERTAQPLLWFQEFELQTPDGTLLLLYRMKWNRLNFKTKGSSILVEVSQSTVESENYGLPRPLSSTMYYGSDCQELHQILAMWCLFTISVQIFAVIFFLLAVY